ncbi:acyltransferase family protein [Acetobacter indonesiensis]
MILVNNPGDWNKVWSPLEHAEWNGCTPADLVFPFFLFLMGRVIPFSFDRRLRNGTPRNRLMVHIAWRGTALIALKLLLSLYPFFHFTHLRFLGVLTRIALCYMAVATLYLFIRKARILICISVVVLLAYWAILYALPVRGSGWPGYNFAFLDPQLNMVAWIDQHFAAWCQKWLHSGVLYSKTSDPEGLLSTLPAIVTTLTGVLAGQLFKNRDIRPLVRATLFMTSGIICLVLGQIWGVYFPLNKSLWTSSFTVFTTGAALCCLSICDTIFDIIQVQKRSHFFRFVLAFFQIFGMNAIFAFLFSGFLAKTFLLLPSPMGNHASFQGWMYHMVRGGHPSTHITSFLFSVVFLFIVFVPLYGLYRKQIFLKL